MGEDIVEWNVLMNEIQFDQPAISCWMLCANNNSNHNHNNVLSAVAMYKELRENCLIV